MNCEEILNIKKSIDKLNEDETALIADRYYLENKLDYDCKHLNYCILDKYKDEIIELLQNKIKTKEEAIKILNRQLEEIDEKMSGKYYWQCL
jgi:hypothetical protein